jgi:hypothetical protein
MREQCLPAPQQPPGSSCCLSLLAGGFRPTTEPCTDRWARPGMVGPACRGQKVFLFWMETINCWGCLSLPPTPLSPQTVPSLQLIPKPRFIFIGNFSACSSLPVQAPPPSTDAMDPKGKRKASIPSASSPPRSSSSVSFWQKKTLLLILIGEIDLDFVFLIYVHCMLQSSGGSDAPPASSVWHSGYPSPPANRHCPGIDPAASAVPPPPPPPPLPQGSGGDGPSRRAPSLPLL